MKVSGFLESAQVRAARSALGWSASDLAEACGITRRTLQKLEREDTAKEVRKSTLLAVKAALEAAGIEFIEADDGAPGIVIRPVKLDAGT